MGAASYGYSAGAALAILPILMMIAVIVGYIIFLVAVWKLMRAHESIAGSLGWIAQSMQERKGGSSPPTGDR